MAKRLQGTGPAAQGGRDGLGARSRSSPAGHKDTGPQAGWTPPRGPAFLWTPCQEHVECPITNAYP